jgi:chromosomal replication initiation ATPase DnaA
MRDNGYPIDHSSIYHGHKKLLKKIEEDVDMKQVVDDIRNECIN